MHVKPVVPQDQQLYGGFGNALSKAIEFVAVPLIFAFIGHVLDGRFGIEPVLTIALGVFGLVGITLSFWYAYVAAMEAEEAKAPWRKR